jgi:hypothetical protein
VIIEKYNDQSVNDMKKNNLLNQRFGRLTVIKSESSDKRGNARWLCQCDCGNRVIVTGVRLRHGITRSCGCLRRDVMRDRFKNNVEMRKHTGRTESLVNQDGISYISINRSARNKSGHIGVSYDKKSDTWFARLMFKNRYVLLKSFATMEEAIESREEAEKQYFPNRTKTKEKEL